MIPLDGIRRRARIATVYCDARSTVDESCEERSVSESGAVLDAMPMPSEEVLPVLYRRGGCGWHRSFGGERRIHRCSAWRGPFGLVFHQTRLCHGTRWTC